MDIELNTFAKRLDHAMKVRGMRAVDLANETGISKSNISRYLSGECEPKSKPLGKIAYALRVDGAWLIGFGGSMELSVSLKEEVKSVIDTMSDDELKKLLKMIDLLK